MVDYTTQASGVTSAIYFSSVTSSLSGRTGSSGTSGTNGSSGSSGRNGTSGSSGVNGTSGTSGISGIGLYLPLSGGTVSGGTRFLSGVTANTISNTTYIDFNTGTTNPSAVGGRIFFDNTAKSLSYYDIIGNNVPIAMGQQLYVRGNNTTGVQINKGSVVMVTGTTNTLPSIVLATNNHAQGSPRPIGLAAENIPNGSDGLIIVNGILSGITLNTFANGATLYLSDTTPGGYVSSSSSLAFTARTNEIGYVLQTGTTTGKIYVNINNEDSNLSLTDLERNILEGNVVSTGVYEYTGMSVASSTTVNISLARGWIVNNAYNFATLPDVTNLYYSGGTGITITNIATADATYILLTSASTITQQTTFPTPQQRRENIFLGKVVHPSRTSILNVNNTVDFDVSPMSALRDLWTPIRLINQGVIPSANTGLTINTTAGTLWGNGIGWTSNQLNPDSVSISAKTAASFFYRTQTGGTSGSVSVIDPTKYDVGGVITSMGAAGADDSSNQRIYLYPTGVINILYGQHKYNNLAAAVAAIQSETFVVYPNAETTGILIGVLSVRNDIVADGQALTNTNYAKFTLVSKFGESFGGTGGLSTTTLQQAYDNSTSPEILTNSTLNGVTFRIGSASDADDVIQIQNGSGVNKITFNGSGRTTTDALSITGITINSGATRFVVVDTSGNTYYRTGGADGTSGSSGRDGTSGTSSTGGGGGLLGVQNMFGNFYSNVTYGANAAITCAAVASANNVANQLQIYPFTPNKTLISSSITVNSVSVSSGSTAKVLIYNHDVINNAPGTKVYESAIIDGGTLGVKTLLTSGFTFTAGTTYWLGWNASAVFLMSTIPTAGLIPLFSVTNNNIPAVALIRTGTTVGSEPTTFNQTGFSIAAQVNMIIRPSG
jgi:hypothetical protein